MHAHFRTAQAGEPAQAGEVAFGPIGRSPFLRLVFDADDGAATGRRAALSGTNRWLPRRERAIPQLRVTTIVPAVLWATRAPR